MKEKKPLLGVKLTGGLEEEITPWAGVSLLIELGRRIKIVVQVEAAQSN